LVDAIAGVRGTRIFKKGDLIDWGVLWHQRGSIEPPLPPGTFEDKFNYSSEAALAAGGWNIVEGSTVPDPVNIVVAGDGTVAFQNITGSGTVAINKQWLTEGTWEIYVDIVAESWVATSDFRLRIGISAGATTYGDFQMGHLSANPGVYQLAGTTLPVPAAGAYFHMLAAGAAASPGVKVGTFGGIKAIKIA